MAAKHFGALLPSAAVLLMFAPALVKAQERLDHREDFRMNSIAGGDFRDYISDHVHEGDRWGHAMRMFGSFHNHMHEMMTALALYGAEKLGDADRIPGFDNRISGGEWSEYRENLEEDGIESAWGNFVQITEIMHDRVHHAMYKSTVYDHVSRGLDADLDQYIGEERAPYPPGETVLRADQVRVEFVSLDRFREFVWHRDFENRHFHGAMQKMIVFDELLYTLMTDWATHGAEKTEAACRPPEVGARISRAQWHEYASRVDDCREGHWRHFVQTVALMHDRIHHMMYLAMLHDAQAHDREEEVRRLLDDGAMGPPRPE